MLRKLLVIQKQKSVDEVWSKSHEHRTDGPMGIKYLENKNNFTSKQKKLPHHPAWKEQ
jgi:hypothetical protein